MGVAAVGRLAIGPDDAGRVGDEQPGRGERRPGDGAEEHGGVAGDHDGAAAADRLAVEEKGTRADAGRFAERLRVARGDLEGQSAHVGPEGRDGRRGLGRVDGEDLEAAVGSNERDRAVLRDHHRQRAEGRLPE